MNKSNKISREEMQKLMYFRIIVIIGIIYLLTFLTSDMEHLPTITETLRFTLHLVMRLGDLLHIFGSVLNKTE